METKFITVDNIFDDLLQRYPRLEECKETIYKAYEILRDSQLSKNCLYVAGNGGSAADSEHIVGELMKSFMSKRSISSELSKGLKDAYGEEGHILASQLEGGLRAVSLPSLISLSTAILNDVNSDVLYAQMINSIGITDDVFWGISTSGNSKNIVKAAMIAKIKGLKVIGLTGVNKCKLDEMCDAVIHVPESETYKIQELHLPVYHALCAMLESYFFA